MNIRGVEFYEYEMTQELVDAGWLIPMRDGYFEDMGGDLIHESSVPEVFYSYLCGLGDDTFRDVVEKMLQARGES